MLQSLKCSPNPCKCSGVGVGVRNFGDVEFENGEQNNEVRLNKRLVDAGVCRLLGCVLRADDAKHKTLVLIHLRADDT